MDFETARINMVEQQIRPWNVLETRTLRALTEIRREDFVLEPYQHLAFADVQVPMNDEEFMLEPKVGARMIEALALSSDHRVLEIGTGTGYLTAILASLCRHVTSIEIDEKLHGLAGRNLDRAGIGNIELLQDDCFRYCAETANQDRSFDRILISGSLPQVDERFIRLVQDDGQAVGIEGRDPAMQVVILRPDGTRQSLFETSVPRLRNVIDECEFIF
ncbi:MAG: protein-L-isoaspartate O-methyltransferase [Gammaproteobacteria bacterium]|nr:protein-L-isoaspartate O-methyltransferase [Gammaproteobacteria bacterium]